MRFLIALSLCLLACRPAVTFACALSVVQAGDPVPWNLAIDFAEIERRLREETPIRVVPMATYLRSIGHIMSGEGSSFYVEFEDGLAAVFKPEESLFDSLGEVGTYAFSQRIGVNLVSPTVLRTLPSLSGHNTGSLQYYVRASRDTARLGWRECQARVSNTHWNQMVRVLYLMAQWDIYPGNLVLDDTDTPALIDNAAVMELQLHRYGSYPFIYKGSLPGVEIGTFQTRLKEVPYHRAKSLKSPTLPEMQRELGAYVSPRILERWFNRIPTFVNQEFKYLIWDGTAWFRRSKPANGPLQVTCFDAKSTATLESVTETELRALLPPGFTPLHRALILDRISQYVAASHAGPVCP